MQINDSPCIATHSVTLPIPAEEPTNNVVAFDPNAVGNVFTVNTGATLASTNFSSLARANTASISATNNPLAQGQQLLTTIAEAMKKATTRKKLVDGSMNNQVAKQFLDVLTGIQTLYTKNRRTLNAAQQNQVMEVYGQVAEGMIVYIGLQENDLKANETLAKNFKTAGANMVAMANSGMSATIKNAIKNRLSSLIALNKPVAGGLATEIRKAL